MSEETEMVKDEKVLNFPTLTNENASNGSEGIKLIHEDRGSKTSLKLNRSRQPVTLVWNNLNYTVQVKDTKAPKKGCSSNKIDKTILHNISGKAKPGELIAIMGPSGSGKTTLLNALAGRIVHDKNSSLTGSITLNGISREKLGSKFARLAAFVQQDDVLFNMQTVYETLMIAARFRLSKKISQQQKEERVKTIIQELGLNKAANTYIGDEKRRGISGGERKRTNVGVELIQDPSLLFLDEPTSGLDSFQALNVVETLKILCSTGCTVITSIHQPRSSIFALVDHLILLADGYIIYDGPAGGPAVNYFNNLGLVCPSYFNPADYFLDIISIDNRSKEDEDKSKQRVNLLIENWPKYVEQRKQEKRNSVAALKFNNEIIETESLANNNDNNNNNKEFIPTNTIQSSFIEQIIVLFIRNGRQIIRDRFTLGIRLFMTLFFSLFLAMTYSDMNNGQKSIQDRSGILFFIAINQSFGPLMNVTNAFPIEKGIVMRERQAKSYYLSSYYITKLLSSIPIEVLFPCIFGAILYFIVGLNPDGVAFVLFLVILSIGSLTAMSIGLWISAMAPSLEATNAIGPPIMIISILFGGFYINSDNIPVWLSWISELSTIKWFYVALCINEFKDASFDCDDVSGDEQCITDGDEVLSRLSFDQYSLGESIRNLILLLIAFNILAYLFLRFKRVRYMDVKDKSPQKANQTNN